MCPSRFIPRNRNCHPMSLETVPHSAGIREDALSSGNFHPGKALPRRPPLQIRIAPYNRNRTPSESCFCVYYMKIPLNTGVSKIIEKNTKIIKEKKSYISHEFLIGLQKFKSTSARLSSYRTNLGSFSKASSSSAQQQLSIKTTASLQIFSLS